MTICIATIAEEKYVVMAADRTLTLMHEPIEFGHEHSSKLFDISDNCIVGGAGSPLPIPDILKTVASKDHSKIKSASDMRDIVVKSVTEVRNKHIEQSILRRFGMDFDIFDQYYRNGMIIESHARRILEEMDKFKLHLSLVLGTVINNDVSIHYIEDPGQAYCCDAIGFITTGSGEAYASQTLVRANITAETPLLESLYYVFEAKKNAEKAIGVGRRTDIRIVTGDKPIVLTDEEISGLNDIYNRKKISQEKYKGIIIKKLDSWKPKSLHKL